jgi:hypothetical protein
VSMLSAVFDYNDDNDDTAPASIGLLRRQFLNIRPLRREVSSGFVNCICEAQSGRE